MFSEVRREQLRQDLLRRAQDDDRIIGAAITGSHAEGTEDAWSDIDLFFGVRAGTAVGEVVDEWSRFCYGQLGAMHSFVLSTGAATYRAFLLADGLEVDLGFAPAASFGPVGGGAFALLFGRPVSRAQAPPDQDFLVGMAWHHVLHAASAIARGRLWAAEHWISAVRDVVLSMASIRHGLPQSYARGADALPDAITAPLRGSLLRDLTEAEARRALRVATTAVAVELTHVDPDLAGRLVPLLRSAAEEERSTRVD